MSVKLPCCQETEFVIVLSTFMADYILNPYCDVDVEDVNSV